MSSIKLESNASGTGIFTIASPNSNTNRTLTLPDNTGTVLTTASTIAGTGVADSASPFETAFGSGAGVVNTGVNNTFIGFEAGNDNTTGTNNTVVGYQALDANTTGSGNTAFGISALGACTTGVDNVAVGDFCASNLTTGSGNICIQDLSDGASDRIFNVTTENNRIVMGHNYVSNAYVKVAWTVTSDSRDKTSIESVPHGLSFVEQLNPVSYRWKTSREDDTPIGNRRYGFLAQEVMALEGDNPIIIDNETPEHLKYQGEALVPVLVNAIKELKAINDAQAIRIEALETKVAALEAK